MIAEIIVLGALGFGFSVGLVLASKRFVANIDEKLEKVKGLLPGRNCGACGFAGCNEYATALVHNPSLLQGCKLLGDEEREELASLLGADSKKVERPVAMLLCRDGAGVKFDYQGARSCVAAAGIGGGFLECGYGCLGFGDCAEACPFGAIEMVKGLPQINIRCTGCGLCVKACPRSILGLLPRDTKLLVRCHSPEAGKIVARVCKNGCIACNICERVCPTHAIKMVDNLPVVDQATCTACGICVEKCPRKVLDPVKLKGDIPPSHRDRLGCHLHH